MNESRSNKRNRNGNFDQDDVDLFLSLVNENKLLIESAKQEDKKKVCGFIRSSPTLIHCISPIQAWTTIQEVFNENCSGVKRDIGALKMKLKNLKAQNKKAKVANESKDVSEEALEENDVEGDQDGTESINTSKEQKTGVNIL